MEINKALKGLHLSEDLGLGNDLVVVVSHVAYPA
jgi:hypothetical protein